MKIGFLFDLDGVLIDSEREYSRIWSEIDKYYPTGVTDFAYRIKGTTLENILTTYFQASDREAVSDMLFSKEQAMRYNYCNGAEELLSALRVRNIPVAIVTSSKKEKMEHLRSQHPELWERVESIVDADSVKRSKPDPQGYLIGAARIGLSAGQCVVVEDSLQGIRAGKSAGCFVVGLTGTFGREVLESEPDILLDCLTEIDLDAIIREMKIRNEQ